MAKILWVIHGDDIYGVKRAIVSLMDGVRAAGWTAEAISLGGGECFDALRERGFDVTSLGVNDSPSIHKARNRAETVWEAVKLLNFQFPLRRKLFAEIRRRQPDAVHTLAKNLLPAASFAAKKADIPCFWEMTNILGSGYVFDLNRRLHHWLIRRHHIFPLANSRHTSQSLGPTEPSAEIMHLGADPAIFDPQRVNPVTRRELGIPDDAIIFAIVSRIENSKGQMLFVESLLNLHDRHVHLLLVGGDGGDGEVQRIRKLAQSRGLSENVHFTGYAPEPQKYIAVSDVVVNSRIDPEPFGLSVVEAMMMTKPLLVHALGGPSETVLDNQTGWHMPQATPAAFAAGIERALADHARWRTMGEAGRERALRFFSVPAQVDWYQRYVEERLKPQK